MMARINLRDRVGLVSSQSTRRAPVVLDELAGARPRRFASRPRATPSLPGAHAHQAKRVETARSAEPPSSKQPY